MGHFSLATKEMPPAMKGEYDRLKKDAKGPAWQFAGLVLIAISIASGSYANAKEKKLELIHIASPQKGDIYEYKIEAGSYSTLKVMETSNQAKN